MTRIFLIGQSQRDYARRCITEAPDRCIVTISLPPRTLIQNNKMWAMLSDISNAAPLGRRWIPESWKVAMMGLLGHQYRFEEGLDGTGPLPFGFQSSKLNIPQMSDLITVAHEYGDRHGVEWKDATRTGFMDI